LIYNAALAKSFAVLAHPLAVILPDFGISMVSPIRFPQLFTPAFLTTFIAAVGLSSIARPTDEKHHTATDCPAK